MGKKVTLPVLHSEKIFTPPVRMDSSFFFSNRILDQLRSLVAGEDITDEVLIEKLTEAYHRAWEAGTCKIQGEALIFDTDMRTKDGSLLRGTLTPDPYDPTPNTWRLSELECVER